MLRPWHKPHPAPVHLHPALAPALMRTPQPQAMHQLPPLHLQPIKPCRSPIPSAASPSAAPPRAHAAPSPDSAVRPPLTPCVTTPLCLPIPQPLLPVLLHLVRTPHPVPLRHLCFALLLLFRLLQPALQGLLQGGSLWGVMIRWWDDTDLPTGVRCHSHPLGSTHTPHTRTCTAALCCCTRTSSSYTCTLGSPRSGHYKCTPHTSHTPAPLLHAAAPALQALSWTRAQPALAWPAASPRLPAAPRCAVAPPPRSCPPPPAAAEAPVQASSKGECSIIYVAWH